MSAEVPLEFPITDPYNAPITFASELLGIGSYIRLPHTRRELM